MNPARLPAAPNTTIIRSALCSIAFLARIPPALAGNPALPPLGKVADHCRGRAPMVIDKPLDLAPIALLPHLTAWVSASLCGMGSHNPSLSPI